MQSEPLSLVISKPLPNSIPLTAGTENIKCAKVDSTESKNGFPIPGFIPRTVHSIVPPTESKSVFAFSTVSLIRASLSENNNGSSFVFKLSNNSLVNSTSLKLLSSTSPILFTCDPINIP